MGNAFSSRWEPSYQRKQTVADCLAIDAAQVLPESWVIASERPWGEDFAEISLFVELWYGSSAPELYIDVDGLHEYVRLEPTYPFGYALPRFWLTCPDCERRVRILYVSPSAARLACRHCLDLCYPSQLVTH